MGARQACTAATGTVVNRIQGLFVSGFHQNNALWLTPPWLQAPGCQRVMYMAREVPKISSLIPSLSVSAKEALFC